MGAMQIRPTRTTRKLLILGGDVKKLSRDEIRRIKKSGIDIHELKGDKGASRFDLYKGSKGNIFIKRKGGGSDGDPTGYNVNDFP
jgi:hypothetical protein